MSGETSPAQPVPFGPKPGRLWSLWDMLTVNARYFLDLGSQFNDLQGVYYAASLEGGDHITPQEFGAVQEHLEKVWKLCRDLRIPTAYALVGTRLDREKLPKTLEAFEILRDAVFLELRDKFFAYIPADRLDYVQERRIASKEVEDAFPSAYYELQRAGNCYALEEPTAAVFHAMRAAEIGLKALGSDLGVTSEKPIEQMDWMPILNGITGKIRDIENKSPRLHPSRDDDLAFYSEAAAQFRFFKNAWRNKVNHVRENYSDHKAKEVVDHVRSFFETLSKRLREPDAFDQILGE